MEYIFKDGNKDRVLITLHGTGGNAEESANLGRTIDKDAAIISVNGEVLENGMRRFFKRHGEGQYDIQDLNDRGVQLMDFLKEKSIEYEFDLEKAVLVGFSNGSNIAINMLLKERSPFKNALLFAPLYNVEVDDNVDLSGAHVFLSMGEMDPIVSKESSDHVISIFESRGANVEKFWVNSHEITGEAIQAAQMFLSKI